ncbi:MAG: stalk domain-containing protein [Defluviitaleaceae bacterium]|nr:stalk domain-containing protein [Defluviitaleaceae bacterium]
MNKERIKGIAAGFILGAILSASVVAASTQTVTRQITYGVGVNLNGQQMHFAYDMRPFVMEGRTFLSVRAIAEALGLPVDFDPATNTAYLGDRFAGQRRPLTHAAPHFDTIRGSSGRVAAGNSSATTVNSVNMGGMPFQNAIRFRTNVSAWTFDTVTSHASTLHNLNGDFRFLTGYVGRVDGTHMTNATISFIGDGQLLQSFELRAAEMPIPITVFVEGITQLRIRMDFNARNSSNNTDYALIAYLE